MEKRLLATALCFVIPVLPACDFLPDDGGSSSELEITTDQRAYSPGEKVAVRFENGYSHAVLYQRCGTALYRGDSEGQPYDGVACTHAVNAHPPVRIRAGEVHTDSLGWFPPDYASGTYQLEFNMTDAEGDLLPAEERRPSEVVVEDG
jgi:hypothetical protein